MDTPTTRRPGVVYCNERPGRQMKMPVNALLLADFVEKPLDGLQPATGTRVVLFAALTDQAIELQAVFPACFCFITARHPSGGFRLRSRNGDFGS